MQRASLVATSILFAGFLALTGCAASTRLRGTWSDPSSSVQPLRRVMIVHANLTGTARRVFEDRFAAALKARSIEGEPSYVLVGDDLRDSARVDLEIHKGHCDGVFVTKVLDDETVRSYYASNGGFQPSRGQGWYTYSRAKGQVVENRVIDMETRLYRVSDGRLIWSGLTRSEFPKSDVPEKQIAPMVKRLVRGLEKSGIALRVGE